MILNLCLERGCRDLCETASVDLPMAGVAHADDRSCKAYQHDLYFNVAGHRPSFHIHSEDQPCSYPHLAGLPDLLAHSPLALGLSMAMVFDDAKVW